MRLLLDAHVSGRVVARRLRERGHDVRAANEEPRLDAWEDEALLELAATERATACAGCAVSASGRRSPRADAGGWAAVASGSVQTSAVQ